MGRRVDVIYVLPIMRKIIFMKMMMKFIFITMNLSPNYAQSERKPKILFALPEI